MNVTDRNVVIKCLTDMLQVLQPDAVSAVAESLSFQQSVLSCRDAVQSLPAPGSGELQAHLVTGCSSIAK